MNPHQRLFNVLTEDWKNASELCVLAAASNTPTKRRLDDLVFDGYAEATQIRSGSGRVLSHLFRRKEGAIAPPDNYGPNYEEPTIVLPKGSLKIEETPKGRVVLFSESGPRPSPVDTFRHKCGAWHRPNGGSMT